MNYKMENIVDVGIGEVKIAQAPSVLRANLGSCVGVVLYEPVQKWGGLAHIVSPESIQELGKVSTSYADIAIPTLLDMLYGKGCRKNNFMCSIGGGGCMFGGASEIMDIGKRNIKSVKKILACENIKITQEKVGGHYSTVILFDTANGNVNFDRQKSNLNIVIRHERNYQKKWVDQSVQAVSQLEAYLRTTQAEYVHPGTQKVDSQKLLNLIRFYSARNKVSRLIGYVVYTKITSEYQLK